MGAAAIKYNKIPDWRRNMSEVKEYAIKEEFAKSFVPAYKQSLKKAEKILAGNKVENNTDEWLQRLIAEAEAAKNAD